MHGYPRAGISQQTGGSRRYSIQNDKGRLAGKLHDLGGHADGSQIEDTGARHGIRMRSAAFAAAKEALSA
jgi:hypothetical protein